jgi:hypothetical protein
MLRPIFEPSFNMVQISQRLNAGGFRTGGFRKIRRHKKIIHIDLF